MSETTQDFFELKLTMDSGSEITIHVSGFANRTEGFKALLAAAQPQLLMRAVQEFDQMDENDE
ncbi:hypothetical protein [Psychromicrobium lacuslunae]|uniref:Uncharacterized protein n=1 Tax=Psychromicrobium lacuslunae TaxID=1618207 RepID=A0A0D4C206_9MICC|nr:hypothetical protein [Psychromicrobium lacuslunae]AJT42406.1 hypothetical protein UM93_14515 [Psychromicrobium lacuslunae]